MPDGQSSIPFQEETVESDPLSDDGTAAAAARPPTTTMATYWCHLCNKEVMMTETILSPSESAPDATCPDCQGGFIESMTTARSLSNVRRFQRRRRRYRSRDTNDYLQAFEFLQFLTRATRGHNLSDEQGATLQEDAIEVAEEGEGEEEEEEEEEEPPLPSSSVEDNGPETREALNRSEVSNSSPVSISIGSPHDEDEDEEDEEDEDEDEEEEEEEEEESGSEIEMPLEFDDWDFIVGGGIDNIDDNGVDWGEIEDDASGVTSEDDEEERESISPTQEREDSGEQNETSRRPDSRIRNPLRTQNQLQEMLWNLEGDAIQLRLGTPNRRRTAFIGNPGDYIDARGFEQLMQQMWENDNSRRGPPPASKTTVESLPSIPITQDHIDDGSALCAICKDSLVLLEPATQLPCCHLYHSDCILSWLEVRNSCPICRFELPTDDPDYESHKHNISNMRSNDLHHQQGGETESTDGFHHSSASADAE